MRGVASSVVMTLSNLSHLSSDSESTCLMASPTAAPRSSLVKAIRSSALRFEFLIKATDSKRQLPLLLAKRGGIDTLMPISGDAR